MKKILFFLLISVSVNAQISTKCAVCPPSLKGVTNGAVLRDSSGVARWQLLSGLDTNAVDVNALNYWSKSGNAGTNPSTNFLGTTDDLDFVLKRNNINLFSLVKDHGNDAVQVKDSIGRINLNVTTVDGYARVFLGTINGGGRQTGIDLLDWSRVININDSLLVNNGKIGIIDGTQGEGKVLTSDANGSASWQTLALTDTATLDFGNILANGHETKTITVTGAALSDVVSLGIPNASMNDHASYVAWVSATDTVSVKCYNFDGSSFDPAAGLFTVKVFK